MKMLLSCFYIIAIAGCSSDKQPEYIKANDAPLIYMSTAKPPMDCKFLGYTTGPYSISNGSPQARNLHQSHINQAKKLGGNYLEKDHLREKGRVYSCPDNEIKKMEELNK